MGEAGQPLIVVSNTSPLTNLAAVGHFDLRQSLFGRLHLARAVVAELSSGGRAWPGATEAENAPWIEVHPVADQQTVDALRLELDAGEAATIVLALQLQADLVLMDEQAGRRAAQYFDLNVMGVVGLLVRAKQRQLIPVVGPLLASLQRQAGFYLSQAVIEHALELANEQ